MNPAALHAAVIARLKAAGIADFEVYDSDVPSAPPAADDGRVYPYAVVWGSAGWTPDEARSITVDAAGALTWPEPVTVAAGSPTWCLDAARAVREALDGYRIGDDLLYEQPGTPNMQRDPDAKPPRWYVPLTFRIGPTV